MIRKIKSTLKEYLRVLKTARRPSKEEFFRFFKMVLFAIISVGFIGMAITLLMGWL